MNPRLRRLQADYQQVMAEFEHHPRVSVIAAEGNPPEKYRIEYKVAGLVPDGEGPARRAFAHQAEIFLPIDYPRRPPFCRMLTPVFHPNINPQKICIGDHWSAGQRLCDLILRIGEMILYQSYNTRSPLNGQAAAWAELHIHELPLENIDLSEQGSLTGSPDAS
jgi:ubiquitin-protein ligase